jgi:hypothetical protein
MEEDFVNEEEEHSNNGSIQSLLTETEISEMTVIEYVCSMAGFIKKDPNRTPLFYGIERTTKSETEGLYFVLTHKEQLKEAERFMDEDFQEIYKAADTYEETVEEYANFGSPYMGSYQRSSNQIAQEIAAAAKHNDPAVLTKQKKNQNRSMRNGITIDYGDFPKMETAKKDDNYWTTSQNQQTKKGSDNKEKDTNKAKQETKGQANPIMDNDDMTTATGAMTTLTNEVVEAIDRKLEDIMTRLTTTESTCEQLKQIYEQNAKWQKSEHQSKQNQIDGIGEALMRLLGKMDKMMEKDIKSIERKNPVKNKEAEEEKGEENKVEKTTRKTGPIEATNKMDTSQTETQDDTMTPKVQDDEGLLTQPENETANESKADKEDEETENGQTEIEEDAEVFSTPAKKTEENVKTPRQSNNSKTKDPLEGSQPRTIDFEKMQGEDARSVNTKESAKTINSLNSLSSKGSWRSNTSKLSRNGTINHHFRKKGSLSSAKTKDRDKAAAKYKKRRSDAAKALGKQDGGNDKENNEGSKEPDNTSGSGTGEAGPAG